MDNPKMTILTMAPRLESRCLQVSRSLARLSFPYEMDPVKAYLLVRRVFHTYVRKSHALALLRLWFGPVFLQCRANMPPPLPPRQPEGFPYLEQRTSLSPPKSR